MKCKCGGTMKKIKGYFDSKKKKEVSIYICNKNGCKKEAWIMNKANKIEENNKKERDILIKAGAIKSNKDLVDFYKKKNKETEKSLWK